MKIGRQDCPAEALVVEGWPIICIGVGEGIESFSGREFEGFTRFLNHDNAITPERFPGLYTSKSDCCGCTACAFRAPRTQSCCFPLMRASYISLSMHPPVSAVGPALKHVRLRVSNGICTQV